MDPKRFARLKEIFLAARDLAEAERSPFLMRECGEDKELLREAEALLRNFSSDTGLVHTAGVDQIAHEGVDLVSDEPAEQGERDSPPKGSTHIGRYRLLQKLGEGGMGEVWEAEQESPVRRRVALKLIKRGMDTKQVIARFKAERQALALMDHPSIARVFDAGETIQGRPYFVMEFVPGVPITVHCDRERLSTRERLALFMLVCEGVQHAHQKAIIHRDLKPSNILVTVQDGRAVPKIIDFGVAKATAQPLTERSLFTELGQLIGTPEYMSPEQAEMTGQNIDTRTDVYSLGAVLYELLVGAQPFDPKELRRVGFDEIRRTIREVEPPRPSTRVSSLGEDSTESASRRRTTPRALAGCMSSNLWLKDGRDLRETFPEKCRSDQLILSSS